MNLIVEESSINELDNEHLINSGPNKKRVLEKKIKKSYIVGGNWESDTFIIKVKLAKLKLGFKKNVTESNPVPCSKKNIYQN